ncbi:MAG TPA: maltose alpha-D-glucosyltransferase [Vicinamibacterales bacterium]|nr:maltose alpha-D-glucosyltransferase [Vicinamibacterales bacterium]
MVPALEDDPLWFKDAIIYELHVRAFYDSNADGIGDFTGLTEKLDYLRDLGVNALWLLPFYPSPLRDDGYDIAKYEGVHPSYGTLGDFRRFMREAHARGIRVITELVINHTSDQHPWFQAARRAPTGSRKRNFYVWSETKQKYEGVRILFTDTEKSNWTWDDVAGAYYWHRFFYHQPDLNYDNPDVLRAVLRVMHFWFEMGVDGMRLDAIPYLIEREGTISENLPETHLILKEIRRDLDQHFKNRFLLAEANQWPADVHEYFGQGDECHMAFHFPLMPRMYMALKQEDRHPITEILRQTPDIPPNCQWALFLRNHDELTLEMVTDEERDYLYQGYAADPQMRINVGIRRRLAPLLENSRRRIELLNSLLFSFPGTPVVYYGDEIGMGDNVYLGDRNGVRTPMQWTGDRNAGFSRADPARLFAPVIMDSVYGYPAINVEAQERSPYSLLNWMKRMISLRRQHQVFGRGTLEFLRPANRKILAYLRRYENEVVLCVANLSRSIQPVELDLSAFRGFTPVEMLGQTEFPRIGDQPYVLTLATYGFYWFQLQQKPLPAATRVVPAEPEAREEAPALFMGAAWDTLLDGTVRVLIERDRLAEFVRQQRWFGGKGRETRRARFVDWGPLRRQPAPVFATIVEVEYADEAREHYFLPLTMSGGGRAEAIERQHARAVLARITGARKGIVHDASVDGEAGGVLLQAIAGGESYTLRHGVLRGIPAKACASLQGSDSLEITPASADQSNSMMVVGNHMLLKLFRRVEPGPNPDVEITRRLGEDGRFARVPQLAGAIEYQPREQPPADVAMLQARIASQADGWQHALGELSRYYERVAVCGAPQEYTLQAESLSWIELTRAALPAEVMELVGAYLESASTLGRRTAEMHLALAAVPDPAFVPEPANAAMLRAASEHMMRDAARTIGEIEPLLPRLSAESASQARTLASRSGRVARALDAVAAARSPVSRIRVHGDYHLGQVLWAENDYYIIDFEGEPARPLGERREKQLALKDIAGMLRSFGYAAYAGLFTFSSTRPDDFARLEPWARAWQLWTSAAFLRTYFDVAGGAEFIPASPADTDRLLDAFVLDKALYEMRYELNNRPEWVRIPLGNILHLLGRLTA